MAPIPEDNQEKQPPQDDSDLNTLSNHNLPTATVDSDFSDEDDGSYPNTAGYMLLPQEPGNDDSDSGSEIENGIHDSDTISTEHHDNIMLPERQNNTVISDDSATCNDNMILHHLPDEVIHSEAGASAPFVAVSSSSLPPEILAKFPDGKVPSYMQIPAIPSNSKESVWNKKRAEKNISSLDSAQESKILKAMSGFSLPMENVPEWAKNMSDEQWNQHVVQQIKSSKNLDGTNSAEEHTAQTLETWTADFPDS